MNLGKNSKKSQSNGFTLFELFDFTSTALGRNLLYKRFLNPTNDPIEIQKRLDLTHYLTQLERSEAKASTQ